jgi:hypothetical protein
VINLQVGDYWLWSLIIFLIQRYFFSTIFIPHQECAPLHAGGGCREGSVPRKKNYLVNVYCNFIANSDRSSLSHISDGRDYVRVLGPKRKPSFMRELYCGCD